MKRYSSAMPSKAIRITVDAKAVLPVANPLMKRIYVSVNAITFVYNQITERYRRIVDMLAEYDKAQGKLHDRSVSFVLDMPRRNELVGVAWDFVDWCERLRKILHASAGVKKRDAWFRAMSSALASVEPIRHFAQHYDAKMNALVAGTYPIKGAVFAFFPADSGIYARVILSTPARFGGDAQIEVFGFNFPYEMNDEIAGVTLSVASLHVDISSVFQRISNAKAELANYLSDQYEFTWPDQ